jgi:hypothetical protein
MLQVVKYRFEGAIATIQQKIDFLLQVLIKPLLIFHNLDFVE